MDNKIHLIQACIFRLNEGAGRPPRLHGAPQSRAGNGRPTPSWTAPSSVAWLSSSYWSGRRPAPGREPSPSRCRGSSAAPGALAAFSSNRTLLRSCLPRIPLYLGLWVLSSEALSLGVCLRFLPPSRTWNLVPTTTAPSAGARAVRAPRLFSSARPPISEFDQAKSSRTKMDSTSAFYVKIRP